MFPRTGQQQTKRNAHNAANRPRAGTAKRSLLPALEVPTSSVLDDLAVVHLQGPGSPTPVLPMDAVARQHIIDSIDDFILQLPLGTGAAAAQLEAAVSAKLLSLLLSNWQVKQRLTKCTSVAQELQELVQKQQYDLQQMQQELQQAQQLLQLKQQQLAAAAAATAAAPTADSAVVSAAGVTDVGTAELRRQLTGATNRLQEVEAAMKQLLNQQSLGSSLQSAQLLAERDAASAALAEATKTATAAQQEAARLRHALLDAEIDTQRSSVAAEAAQRKAAELEAELCEVRSRIAAAMSEAETERRKLTTAEAAAATSYAQLLEAQAAASKAQLEAVKAQQQAEMKVTAVQLQCGGCADKAGKLLSLQEELQGLQTSKTTLQIAVQDEQQYGREATRRLEECRMDLERARITLSQAEQQRNELYAQLYGSDCSGCPAVTAVVTGPALEQYPVLGWSAEGSTMLSGSPQKACGDPENKAAPVYGSWYSPVCTHWMQRQQPPGEGLFQRCENLQLQLRQQGVEVKSLREQLLELQLQLSDAHSAAGMAQQQLQDTRSKLVAAEAAAAQASAEAAAAVKEGEQHKQQVFQLQLQGPELAAAKNQLEKLEAQQRVLLADLKEAMNAAADASASQAIAANEAEASQIQLQGLRVNHEAAEKAWQQEKAQLLDEVTQLSQRLSAAEAAANSGLHQAAMHAQEQLEQLSAGHTARVDALRAELAADAARRAEAEAKAQALQQQHAQQLATAKDEVQRHLLHQQTLQQTITMQKAELAGAEQKLTAAEAALVAAKSEAAAQLAAATKEQERSRQQLLEVRGDRLQLQEQLSLLQRTSGGSQLLADQLSAAQKDAATVAAELRQQLVQRQQHAEGLQQQVQQLQQEIILLECKLAEARAGKEAAAKQAAVAGEKLATAVAAQEALRQQLEGLGAVPGSYQSPSGSPYRTQLSNNSRTVAQLTHCLANTEAQLAALAAELEQSQQDNVALVQELQRLQSELQDSRTNRVCDSRAAQTSPAKHTLAAAAEGRSGVPRLQAALQDLMQLTQAMEVLEQRLAQQAAASDSSYTDFTPSSSTTNGPSYLVGLAAAGHSNGMHADALHLSSAAVAVADLHRQMRRVSRELRAHDEKQQLASIGDSAAERDAQQVQALRRLVQQMSTELSDREALLADLPALQKQLLQLSQELAQREDETADVIGLKRQLVDLRSQLEAAKASASDAGVADLRCQVADLQSQLAAASSAADTNSNTSDTLHKLLSEMAELRGQVDAARQQHDDVSVSTTAAAAAEAAVAAAAAATEAERLQCLVLELQAQLTAANAEIVNAAEAREKVATELRFLQNEFENVTGELHRKQQQLKAQQARLSEVGKQLSAVEAAASTAQAQEQQLKQHMLDAQAEEATARHEAEAAQQQLLHLQSELQQLRGQLQQQQVEAAAASPEEPTLTAQKMTALLVQKDKDLQRLQQLLQDQQKQIQQLQQEQMQSETQQLSLAADHQAQDVAANTTLVQGADSSDSYSATAQQQDSDGLGVLHSLHLTRSLRNTDSRSSSRGRSEGATISNDDGDDLGSGAVSLAASRTQSIGGYDVPSRSRRASFSASSVNSGAGSLLEQQQRLRSSSSSGAARSSNGNSFDSIRSSNGPGNGPFDSVTGRTVSHETLNIRPGAADNKQPQRLDRSPSRRAATVAAAAIGGTIGSRETLMLPSSGNTNSNAPSEALQIAAAVTAGSSLAPFKDNDRGISSNTDKDLSARTGASSARLSCAEPDRAISRQNSSSRAAQIAAGIASDSLLTPAAAAAGMMSSSDDDSDDSVGALGGLSKSTSSRRVSSSSSKVPERSNSINATAARQVGSGRLSAGDITLAGVGSLSSSVGNIRQSFSSSSSSGGRRVSAPESIGSGGASSRAKLLAEALESSSGGYDAEKLQRSLSAGRRQEQQVLPSSAMQRTRHASAGGALQGSRAGGLILASTGADRPTAGAGLKPALSTSRAARIAGVMRSVSFKEPTRH